MKVDPFPFNKNKSYKTRQASLPDWLDALLAITGIGFTAYPETTLCACSQKGRLKRPTRPE
jgi:hypothetical protein